MSLHRPVVTISQEPPSPVAKERFRERVIEKQSHVRPIEQVAEEWAKTSAKRTFRPPIDVSQLCTSPRVQDWADLTGTRRSLPSSMTDQADHHINVNYIRSNKMLAPVENLGDGTGKLYNNAVLTGSWQDARFDPSYVSGFIPKELRRQQVFESEYSERYRPKESEYQARLQKTYGLAGSPKSRPSAADVLPGWDCIQYARQGFGVEEKKDHTPAPLRGAPWVGTSPVKMYHTTKASAEKADGFEFQIRDPAVDPKAHIFKQRRAPEDVKASVGTAHEPNTPSDKPSPMWRSVYTSDFTPQSTNLNAHKPWETSSAWSSPRDPPSPLTQDLSSPKGTPGPINKAGGSPQGPPSPVSRAVSTLRGPPSPVSLAGRGPQGPPSPVGRAMSTPRGPPSPLNQAGAGPQGPPSPTNRGSIMARGSPSPVNHALSSIYGPSSLANRAMSTSHDPPSPVSRVVSKPSNAQTARAGLRIMLPDNDESSSRVAVSPNRLFPCRQNVVDMVSPTWLNV